MKSRFVKILYALLIGVALVLFWRGIWMLADEVLFPGNPLISSLTSIAVGIIILVSYRKLVDMLAASS